MRARPHRFLQVRSGIERMSPGVAAIFDMGPALEGERGASAAKLLKLSEGQDVEIVGTLRGGVTNVSRFELGPRVCALEVGGQRQYAPYRGTTGGEGVIVEVTPENPLYIRRIRSGLHVHEIWATGYPRLPPPASKRALWARDGSVTILSV